MFILTIYALSILMLSDFKLMELRKKFLRVSFYSFIIWVERNFGGPRTLLKSFLGNYAPDFRDHFDVNYYFVLIRSN